MKYVFIVTATLLVSGSLSAQDIFVSGRKTAGTFSLGTRNTISMFNDDKAIGTGIGGQFRIQMTDRMNTEWYFDYITSKNGTISSRNDYHIGWSVMMYTKNNYSFDRFLQPYLIVGHCFDYSKVWEQKNKANEAHRLSMATQAGLGTHININKRLDCSLSSQYMLHFGKDIEVEQKGEEVLIAKKNSTTPDGHLLFAVSFNYKLFHLWN